MASGRQKGFIVTAAGAVMGLGGAMRFPALCAKYGAAFIIAYLLCLIVVGYPLVCAEIELGKRYRGSFDYCLSRVGRGGRTLGRLACLNSAFIALYDIAIAAALLFSAASFLTGGASQTFNALTVEDNFSCLFYVVLLLSCVGMIYFVVGRAGKLKSAAKFSVCLSLAMFALLSARGLLYKNSLQALAALFLPNIAKLTSGRLWLDALSQMLLSLSLAAGVMPTFAADCATLATKKCAAIIAGANFFGCMLSSVALFTCMFGCGLFGEVTSSFSTFQAAFVVYPAAIRQMFKSRLLGNALGFAFYISLFFTAMQSALSLISPLIKSISFGSGKNLKQSAGRICVCLCLLILPFACKFRLQLINSCDFLACTIIAPILCAGECILLAGQTIFSRYKNGKGAV